MGDLPNKWGLEAISFLWCQPKKDLGSHNQPLCEEAFRQHELGVYPARILLTKHHEDIYEPFVLESQRRQTQKTWGQQGFWKLVRKMFRNKKHDGMINILWEWFSIPWFTSPGWETSMGAPACLMSSLVVVASGAWHGRPYHSSLSISL